MRRGRWDWPPGPQLRERLAVSVLGLVCGSLPVIAWWGPDPAALQALEQELAQLQARLPAHSASDAPANGASAPMQMDWPHPHEQTAAWTWLQQRVQAQGLQVQALQVQPVGQSGELPERPVRMRLQGPWHGWLALLEAFEQHVPWWVIDRWQVVPAGTSAAQVQIDLQGRLGLQPAAVPPGTLVRQDWPVWSVRPAVDPPGAGVFALTTTTAAAASTERATASASEGHPPSLADPRLWPVEELQLLGVWWQAGQAHAVLGRGLLQVTVSVGQRVGREAYRVRRISQDGVELVGVAGQERGRVRHVRGIGER